MDHHLPPAPWSQVVVAVIAACLLGAACEADTSRKEVRPASLCIVGDREGRVIASFDDFGCQSSSKKGFREGACAIEASGDALSLVVQPPSYELAPLGMTTHDCRNIQPIRCSSVPLQSWRRRIVLDKTEIAAIDVPVTPTAPACFPLLPGGTPRTVERAGLSLMAFMDPLHEAREALHRGSFVACANLVGRYSGSDEPARVALEAAWLGAQCALLSRDHDAARTSLQRFIEVGDRGDLRHPIVEAQLAVLARGGVPDGLRTAPATQAEAEALVARLRESGGSKPLGAGFVVERGQPVVLGGLEARIVDQIVTEKLDELRRCMTPGTIAPDGRLPIVLKWVVNGAGKVMQAKLGEGSGTPSDESARCLTTRVLSWTFPALSNQGVTIIVQPLVFQSVAPSGVRP